MKGCWQTLYFSWKKIVSIYFGVWLFWWENKRGGDSIDHWMSIYFEIHQFFFLLLFLSSMSLFLFNIGRFQWSIWRYMYNSKMIDKYGWIADKKAESPKNKSQTKGHFETSVNLSLPLSFFPSMHLSFLPAWVKIQIHVSHNCSCLSYQMQIYHTRHKIKKNKLYNLNSFAMGLGVAVVIIIAASSNKIFVNSFQIPNSYLSI